MEVIVKYHGDILVLGYETEILTEKFAIITVNENKIHELFNHIEVEYIEMPKQLSFNQREEPSNRACVPYVHSESGYALRGNGTVVAVIDSGIDYRHSDFRNDDGTSRIAYIWDQSLPDRPEFTNRQINSALESENPLAIVPHEDTARHGTSVAGIAAGKTYGVAPEADIISVKLASANTIELMRGVRYAIDRARAMGKPLAINISYGTNSGGHDGSSLVEEFLDAVSQQWKCVIVVASGNEGAAGHHFSYRVRQNATVIIELSVAPNITEIFFELWKNFVDEFEIELIEPTGATTGPMTIKFHPLVVHFDHTTAQITAFSPTHYNIHQGFRCNIFNPLQGLWKCRVTGTAVVDGRFNIWLPTTEEVTERTAFLRPALETTLTLPSTANKVITVGAYDARVNTIAPFSGRGFTRNNEKVKPDLVAPGVNVVTSRAGGGSGSFSGTSMSAPFVAGSAAVMMEWGIVLGNDPFLYGQKIKAYLRKGAARKEVFSYPNNMWGYGSLCLKDTMDYLIRGT
jgi:subtilisin family serine protease